LPPVPFWEVPHVVEVRESRLLGVFSLLTPWEAVSLGTAVTTYRHRTACVREKISSAHRIFLVMRHVCYAIDCGPYGKGDHGNARRSWNLLDGFL